MQNVLTRWTLSILVIAVVGYGIFVLYESEQARPVTMSKGVYSGTQDHQLEDDAVGELRQRTDKYRGLGI